MASFAMLLWHGYGFGAVAIGNCISAYDYGPVPLFGFGDFRTLRPQGLVTREKSRV